MVIVIILWSLVSWSAAPWPGQRCGRHSAVAGTARWLAQRTGRHGAAKRVWRPILRADRGRDITYSGRPDGGPDRQIT